MQRHPVGMLDDHDTDTLDIVGFDDTAEIDGYDDTFDLDETDRVTLPRARTQADWPPAPPPPQPRSRRHKAVYPVARAQTASDHSH